MKKIQQWNLFILGLVFCLQSIAIAKGNSLSRGQAKRMLMYANSLYKPNISLEDIIESWNLDFNDTKRLRVASDYSLNRESLIAPLALNKEKFTKWSKRTKVQKVSDKKEVLNTLSSCVFPGRIFMRDIITTSKSQELAKRYLNYLSLFSDLKFYRISDNWIFISSGMFQANHSDCIFGIEDSEGKFLLLQAVELWEDFD